MFSRRARLCAATTLVLVSAGCARFRAEANKPDKLPEGPNDGNITAMLLAANNTDISYAQLAPRRTASPAVREYATRMIVDHSAVNSALTELVQRSRIEPEENSASLYYRDESTAERDLMRGMVGRQFDSTYIANEINYHLNLLKTLDTVLIPRARDAQLRQVLVSVRPAVVSHLDHAQKVQAGLH
jgi:putative membrane protein